MKLTHEQHQIQLTPCGTVCDRCGAVQLDDPGISDCPALPPYIVVTVDRGPGGVRLRGHFCLGCDAVLQASAGGWNPYLRSISRALPDGSHHGLRYQVQDAATGERRWIESLLDDEFV